MEMGIEKGLKKEIIKGNKVHDTDTGSPEVQIALLTERIKQLVLPASLYLYRVLYYLQLSLFSVLFLCSSPSPIYSNDALYHKGI